MIHSTAIVDPAAEVDATAQVGPFTVIEAGVQVGPHCRIGPHVHVCARTILGAHNRLHAGCVVGDAPQDLKYHDAPTRLRLGEHNILREHVTLHRSNKVEEDTVIGSHCLFMANAHVGHNCQLGDGVIMANGVLLGGHVTIGDRAFLSGNCLVHQFVRVGTLAMMQGGAAISKDLPPFTIARGDNGICGLNTVGLRRAGFNTAQRLELKQLYRALFREHRNLGLALVAVRGRFTSPAALQMLEFVATSKRGVVADPGGVPRRPRAEEEAPVEVD